MKRWIYIMLVVAVLTFVLSACSSNAPQNEAGIDQPLEDPIEGQLSSELAPEENALETQEFESWTEYADKILHLYEDKEVVCDETVESSYCDIRIKNVDDIDTLMRQAQMMFLALSQAEELQLPQIGSLLIGTDDFSLIGSVVEKSKTFPLGVIVNLTIIEGAENAEEIQDSFDSIILEELKMSL